MSISYSGVVNYGKAILPSVESWGTNNNILRDPPRSITTRRIDKVTDTIMLDEDIDQSMDRVAESILVYPRGSNVMVGISYNNQGRQVQQAKLPYRVMKDGVFRPPILRPVDLVPLSRLPRNNVTIDPIVNNVDFTKKIMCPGTAKDYRSVKNETLQVQATAVKTKIVDQPVEIAAKQNILADKVRVQAVTQKTRNIERPIEVSARNNIQNVLNTEAFTNVKFNQHAQHAQTQKYTKNSVVANKIQGELITNQSQNRYVRPVESKIVYHANQRPQATAQSNVKGIGEKHSVHEVQEMRMKPILRGEMNVQASGVGLFNADTIRPTGTRVSLPKRAEMGSHMSTPLIPSFDRMWDPQAQRLKNKTFNQLMMKKN